MCQSNSEVDQALSEGMPPAPLASHSPLKFWQIEESLRCPVIGICLTPIEQKHLPRKAGISIKNKSPYAIHMSMHADADQSARSRRQLGQLKNEAIERESRIKRLQQGRKNR